MNENQPASHSPFQDIPRPAPAAPASSTPPTPQPTKHIHLLPTSFALLAHGMRIYKQEWKTFIGLGILYVLQTLVFSAIIGAIAALGLASIAVAGIIGIVVAALIGIAVSVLFYWLMTWVLYSILLTVKHSDEHIGVREALSLAHKHVWAYLWVGILTALIIIGTVSIFALIGFIILTPITILAPGALGFLAMLGLFILILLALIVTITWFGFTNWTFIDQDARGLHALALSKHLSHKHFAPVAERFCVILIVYVFAAVVIQGLLTIAFSAIPGDFGPGLAQILMNIVALMVLVPIVSASIFALYQAAHAVEVIDVDSKEHGEHRGILIMLAALGLLVLLALPIGTVIAANAARQEQNVGEDAVRKSSIDTLQTELELYYESNHQYPDSLLQLLTPSSPATAGVTKDTIDDPVTGSRYSYKITTDNQSYSLCATLSDGSAYCEKNAQSKMVAAPVIQTAPVATTTPAKASTSTKAKPTTTK